MSKTDPLMKALIEGARLRRGTSRAILGSELHKYQTGVQIPHLMMERLFGLNVIPCSSLIEVAGLPESCKSAFLQYLFKVYVDQGFGGVLVETEGKISYTLLESFLLEKLDQLFLLRGPLRQEEWQNELLVLLKTYRANYVKQIKTKKGKESIVPYLVGLDSLGGTTSSESMATVDKEGSAGRSFPIEALKNKVFFEQLPVRLMDLPLTLVFTNHEKPEDLSKNTGFPGARGRVSRVTKGGVTPGFFCGLRLFFEKATNKQEIRKGVTQQILNIEVCKNSFNETGTKMRLPMQWTNVVDPATGEVKQVTVFRWDEALAQFLAPSVSGFNYDRKAVSKFLMVKRVSATKFDCDQLKLKGVSAGEMGRAIEADAEIKAKLRPYLGIKSWRAWDGNPITTEITDSVNLPDPDEVLEELRENGEVEDFNIEEDTD